jgi:hypothetical protein
MQCSWKFSERVTLFTTALALWKAFRWTFQFPEFENWVEIGKEKHLLDFQHEENLLKFFDGNLVWKFSRRKLAFWNATLNGYQVASTMRCKF